MGCYFLPQGILLTQGLKLGPLYWQADFLPRVAQSYTLIPCIC